ncbi:MAG: hypothetical protein ACLPKB_08100 [Xanthobacteraceae bacterium]
MGAAVIELTVAGEALAADNLPPAAPAQVPGLALAPVYDWTGIYVGGHIGSAWDGRGGGTFDTTGGPETGVISTHASGIMGGGQFGLNYALAPNWLIGFETDISTANLESTPF